MRSAPRCQVCGETDVVWRRTSRGWVLKMRSRPRLRHRCPTFELELKRRGLRYQAGRRDRNLARIHSTSPTTTTPKGATT